MDRHVLVVGDCLGAGNLSKCVDGSPVHLTFTSPPYNAGGTVEDAGPQGNRYAEYVDRGGNWYGLLHEITARCLSASPWMILNVQMLAGNKISLIEYLYAWRHNMADVAVWVKEHGVPARSRKILNSRFEFLWFLSNKTNPKRILPGDFHGTVDNVYFGNRNNRNPYSSVNGALMPLHLAKWVVGTFTRPGERILDPFAGCGTTLIACEELGRDFCGVELSPQCADVVLDRWERMTGKVAVRCGHINR